MQKWEYLMIHHHTVRENEKYVGYWAMNGSLIEPRTNDFVKVANDLGAQGWEIATVGNQGAHSTVFKRPTPATQEIGPQP